MEPKTKTRAAVDVAVAFVVLPFLLITPVVVIIFLFVKYYLFKCRDISGFSLVPGLPGLQVSQVSQVSQSPKSLKSHIFIIVKFGVNQMLPFVCQLFNLTM